MLILDAIIPIALVVIIGVLLVKSGYVSDGFFPELSKLVFRVFVPVFLFVVSTAAVCRTLVKL